MPDARTANPGKSLISALKHQVTAAVKAAFLDFWHHQVPLSSSEQNENGTTPGFSARLARHFGRLQADVSLSVVRFATSNGWFLRRIGAPFTAMEIRGWVGGGEGGKLTSIYFILSTQKDKKPSRVAVLSIV